MALLEILSKRDLDVLAKVYSKSVLLGDQSEKGWGIKYTREFDMTNDSKLFPPRPKWEEWGYRPDEYSRWIKGPWKPIEELYSKLGISPLRNGDLRCAQPPYDKLPIPRADIPEGIILSREADAWIHEQEIPEVSFTDGSGKPLRVKRETWTGEKTEIEVEGPAIAVPLYEGRMIGQYDFSNKGWVSGKGRSAIWRDISWSNKDIEPQYLMGSASYLSIKERDGKLKAFRGLKPGFMGIGSSTNSRSMISSIINDMPCGNAVPILPPYNSKISPILSNLLNSYGFDFVIRCRLVGLNLNYFVIAEAPIPEKSISYLENIQMLSNSIMISNQLFSAFWLYLERHAMAWKQIWAVTLHERTRIIIITNAISFVKLGYELEDVNHVFSQCDYSIEYLKDKDQKDSANLNPKGFWRLDNDKPPEHRQTLLTLIAFHDLQEKINSCGGDMNKGIEAFCNQNNGEGWMLPETIRLADYGLGHDDRAKESQPVRECFGPRFYDWQLAQSAEESWRECHLHARNLLGKEGYQRLLDEVEGRKTADQQAYLDEAAESEVEYTQGTIFDN